MADIMEVHNHSVKRLHEVDMPSPHDDRKNDHWCLDCAYNVGKPGRPPCNHPPDEETRLSPTSSEDPKRRICRRIYALKQHMEWLHGSQFQETPPNIAEITTHNKYQQQFLLIALFVRILYTNEIGHKVKKKLDAREYIGENGESMLAIGICDLGLWMGLNTELDAEPDFLRLVPHETVMGTSGHGTSVTTSELNSPRVI